MIVTNNKWVYLKTLNLGLNKFGDEGLKCLLTANWPQLEDLDIQSTGITIEGIEILVAKSNWSHLKKLNLSRNSIKDEDMDLLSRGKWPKLESLDLYGTQITKNGVKILINTSSNWLNMKSLALTMNVISYDEVRYFSKTTWPHFYSLITRGA